MKPADQLLAAARTVTQRTPPRRRRYIADRLSRLRTPEARIYAFYIASGTVPRSLWQE